MRLVKKLIMFIHKMSIIHRLIGIVLFSCYLILNSISYIIYVDYLGYIATDFQRGFHFLNDNMFLKASRRPRISNFICQ